MAAFTWQSLRGRALLPLAASKELHRHSDHIGRQAQPMTRPVIHGCVLAAPTGGSGMRLLGRTSQHTGWKSCRQAFLSLLWRCKCLPLLVMYSLRVVYRVPVSKSQRMVVPECWLQWCAGWHAIYSNPDL